VSRVRTAVCELFGIRYPIFCAGMGGVTLAPLAGAVSAAGGLGVLGATFLEPDALRAEIAAVRRITDRPFGVDLLIPTDIPADTGARALPPFPSFLADLLPEVEGLPGACSLRLLDLESVEGAMADPESFRRAPGRRLPAPGGMAALVLPPFAVARLDGAEREGRER